MIPVSVIVPTLNEELNLARCLRSVHGWCDQVFVVDSGSQDRTLEIAHEHAADVHHVPYNHTGIGPYFFQWSLDNLPIRNDWVLLLEADRAVSPELHQELETVFARSTISENGFYIRRVQIFRGKQIRYGGYGSKRFVILFRRAFAKLDPDEKDTRVYIQGTVGNLTHPVIEDNAKENDILFYLSKHLRYAEAFAEEEVKRRKDGARWRVEPSLLGSPDQRTLALKDLYHRMPPYMRPLLYFLYRYFVRLGVLDGKEGALFHFLQGFWFRLVVDVRIEELLRDERLSSSRPPRDNG